MTIPDYQSLMLPLLKVAAKGETRVPDAADKIADLLGLSDDERTQLLPSGKQRILHNRVHWAKFYMSKAGLIDSPARGRFLASPAGITLLAKNPLSIDVEVLKKYPSFSEFYANSGSTAPIVEKPIAEASASSSATPEEQVDAANAVLKSALRVELLQRIQENSPSFFEQLIVTLLVAMGYGGSHENAALKLGRSGDGGIDGIIDEDRLGLDRIYVQAKRYASHASVGRPEVQGFAGSLLGFGAAKGVFVTTSSFSSPAIDYARGLTQRIVLIDGSRLTDLMIEYNVGTRVSRVVELKRLDEDFFSGE